jgi:hypothetical protein
MPFNELSDVRKMVVKRSLPGERTYGM